jgi:hypothetical protein
VTYSIRRILLWTLVFVPLTLAIVGVVLAFVLQVPADDHGIAR